ncbi:hypothetical protein [Streptomyces sp. NPDC001404]|uniref:hypothetical protein n=1 Tax=Streptomyces sp. NPDC001404 TaxID=3364571 RepID=UPI00367F085E
MTGPARRPPADISTVRQDPCDSWPDEARALTDHLVGIYGDHDPLPTIAGEWIARQKSARTRSPYSRAFRRWEEYARSAGIHPLEARSTLAESFAAALKAEPARVRVKGGHRGETAPAGGTLSASTQAQTLAACSSFYSHALGAQAVAADPFTDATRPKVTQPSRRTVRVPRKLWDEAVEKAKRDRRTVNDVVVAALEDYVSAVNRAKQEHS